MTADLTIRLLTPDLDWDDYLDLVMRAFGQMDGSRIQANIEPAAADLAVPLRITDDLCPANSGLWQLTVRDGIGCLSEFRTGHGDSPRSAASHQHIPLALGARGLAALYAGTPVATLRRAGPAAGGSPDADAALDGAFAATPYMLDPF